MRTFFILFKQKTSSRCTGPLFWKSVGSVLMGLMPASGFADQSEWDCALYSWPTLYCLNHTKNQKIKELNIAHPTSRWKVDLISPLLFTSTVRLSLIFSNPEAVQDFFSDRLLISMLPEMKRPKMTPSEKGIQVEFTFPYESFELIYPLFFIIQNFESIYPETARKEMEDWILLGQRSILKVTWSDREKCVAPLRVFYTGMGSICRAFQATWERNTHDRNPDSE